MIKQKTTNDNNYQWESDNFFMDTDMYIWINDITSATK